jgi:hypothetical protein
LSLAVAAQADYKTFTPGSQVKKWGTEDEFEISGKEREEKSGNLLLGEPSHAWGAAGTYFIGVGMKRVLPVVIVGVLLFLGICCWACQCHEA